jgi:hypothetical protein
MDLNVQVRAKKKRLTEIERLTCPGMYGLVGRRNKLFMQSTMYWGETYSFPFSIYATGRSMHI